MKPGKRFPFPAGPPATRDTTALRRDLLRSLLEIAAALTGPGDLGGVVSAITRELGLLIPIDRASIALIDESTQDLSVRVTYSRREASPPVGQQLVRVSPENPYGWVVLNERPLWRNDVEADLRFSENPAGEGMRSEMVVPLRIRDRVLGTLNLASATERAFTASDFDILQKCGQLAAVAVENQLLYRQTRENSLIDPLTGVYNQRHFRHLLGVETGRAARYSRRMALLMIDVDDFKRVNDTFGHPVGDRVLRGVAGILRGGVRGSDVLARYGGEEFSVILQETDPAAAQRVAEKLRADVETKGSFPDGKSGSIRATVSIGWALYPRDAEDAESLVQRADEALYRAKRTGKNRVCAWQGHVP